MRGVFKELKGILHRSVAERGVLQTLKSAATRGPLYLRRTVAELVDATSPPSDFDARHGVQTDSDRGKTTPLRTLRIASANWMQGEDYSPVDPDRFRAALSALRVPVNDFTFVDFGSGKGRADSPGFGVPIPRARRRRLLGRADGDRGAKLVDLSESNAALRDGALRL